MTDDTLEIILDMKSDFVRYVMPETHRKILELKGEFDSEWAAEQRTAYLKDKMVESILTAWKWMGIEHAQRKRRNIMGQVFATTCISDAVRQLITYQGEVIRLRDREGGITPEHIETARAYPFDRLIEMKNGKAKCPFHPDKDPSFSVRNNRGKCWGCGWSGDPIDFVRDREGLRFVDAVKRLQEGQYE